MIEIEQHLKQYCEFLSAHILKFSELLVSLKLSKDFDEKQVEEIFDKIAKMNAELLELTEKISKLRSNEKNKIVLDMSSSGISQIPEIIIEKNEEKIKNKMLLNALNYMQKMTVSSQN